MHSSVIIPDTMEVLNLQPFKGNPLISKCQIKVCYVSDEPNRNRSVITKETATQMGATLRGCPIVGYYNEEKQDFEEHNRIIDISNGQFKIKDTTRPYGFVDLDAKVWFQKFLDDGEIEREYLMTEGWLWTGQYPEAQRIIAKGNNQSMELSEEFLDASWTKDINGKSKFFIINEAIISKLCVLGEDVEPCFEGASITQFSLSFDEDFKNKMFSMMNELKEIIEKGGTPVYTMYAVEIGDTLWCAVYDYLRAHYPRDEYSSTYRLEGIFEENGQKFIIVQHSDSLKYYRINFTYNDETGFTPSDTLIEVTQTYVPAEQPQFPADAIAAYVAKKKEEEKGKTDKEDNNNSKEDTEEENSSENTEETSKDESPEDEDDKKKKYTKDEEEEEEKCPECGKLLSECICEEKKKTYSIEEYEELASQYAIAQNTIDTLKTEIASLMEFKNKVERKEKEAMIDSFYMLSDDDKEDVINNIDTYSLDDIEAKLSIICVRNRVSFDLDNKDNQPATTTYSLNSGDYEEDATTPAWVKAVRAVAKKMNN